MKIFISCTRFVFDSVAVAAVHPFIFFVVGYFAAFSLASQAVALSCAQDFPFIGVVSKVDNKGGKMKIILEHMHRIESGQLYDDQIITIDQYEIIAQQYQKDHHTTNLPLPSEFVTAERELSFSQDTFEKLRINKGDIVVKGSPLHVCSYGFLGIFSDTGKIKTARVNDGYSDYQYKKHKLVVKPGKALTCDRSGDCKVLVHFSVGDQEKILLPKEEAAFQTGPFRAIRLLRSSNVKSGSNDLWGFGVRVAYLIDFIDTNSDAKKITLPVTNKNIFSKVWHWLLSLF